MPLSERDYMRRPSPPSRKRFINLGRSSPNPLWALIILNIIIYLVTSISDRAFGYLALDTAFFSERPWTLLTAMFVHDSLPNVWHIFFNMFALYVFGRALVSLVGNPRFLLVYFLGGIIGNVVFILFNLSSRSILVGASGAVYAIAGCLVVMVPNMMMALWGIIPMRLWVFVIVFMLLLSVPPFVSISVAWQAHIGGLVAGLGAGYYFRKRYRWIY